MDPVQIALTAGVVVVLPYVAGPVLVKSALSMNPRVTLKILDDDIASLPPQSAALFADAHQQFEALGYTASPFLSICGYAPGAVIQAAFFADPRTHDAGMVAALYASQHGNLRFSKSIAEFCTTLKDGRTINATTSWEISLERTTPDRTVVRLPTGTPIPELHRLHRLAMDRWGRGQVRAIPDGEWWATLVHEAFERTLTHQEEAGYSRADSRGVHRLTWKGAMVATWRLLPPFKQITRHRAAAPARELLRSAPIP